MGKILLDAIKHNAPFWLLTVTAVALIVAAFLLPPTAVIDGSVLAAVGELAGFGALWALIKAMDLGIDARVKHNGTEVTIGDITEAERERGPHVPPCPKAEDYDEDYGQQI